ncbi:MAG: restriction endonuclease subunit S [Oceanospirillaceae bacterium]|nr:restriction endonuclease subunit S [Oceanospirillaceae bacterium]
MNAPYPEYKDSTVLWAGKIPKHWSDSRIKFVSTCLDGKRIPLNAEQRGEMPGDYPYWGANGVVDHIDQYLFDEDLVLLGEDGAPFFDSLKDVAFNVSGKVWVNNHAHILRPVIDKIENRFLRHVLNSVSYKLYINGSTRDKLTQAEMNDIAFPLPPVDEQETISEYLDSETSRIDSLISEKQRFIELLKEKRQALISHVVTKGLDANVEMKDSGVEWIGVIPKHWIIRRLKHSSVIQSGIAKGKDVVGKETIAVPMLRVANVQDGYLDLNDVHMIDIEPRELERYSLREGDLLMNEGGDNDKLGRGTLWTGSISPCIHQNHVFAIRILDLPAEWVAMLTRASYAKFHFYRSSKQSTNLASISSSNIKLTPLVVPPIEEINNILKYLESELSKIDSLIDEVGSSAELLKEHRSALINAAVTGKIDVRGFDNKGAA